MTCSIEDMENLKSYQDPEWQADAFAGELLVPTRMIQGLSMKEICAYLGVSHDTIFRWIANYDMPSMKMGRCWKFKKDQIDAWLAKGDPEKIGKI